jgi:hypothetical protein
MLHEALRTVIFATVQQDAEVMTYAETGRTIVKPTDRDRDGRYSAVRSRAKQK